MDDNGKPAPRKHGPFNRSTLTWDTNVNAWFFRQRVLSTKGASTSCDTAVVELFTQKKKKEKEIVFTLFTKSIYKAASDGTVSDAS